MKIGGNLSKCNITYDEFCVIYALANVFVPYLPATHCNEI